uniref:Outer dense fiber protein 3-like n=1 Tax=Macrostomum lignano TaxID=282301 RepID=A0A1I8ISE8_9PLAT
MVYNYTKPRGPVAAMYSSPGPKYGLPGLVGQPHHDPRSVHNRGPAYQFGMRHGKFSDDSSPGPCYLPGARIFRDGKDGTPQYSLYGRPKDGTMFSAPGPGAYKTDNTNKEIYSKAPAYSFGVRHMEFRTDNTPGPNAYTPDPMMGKTLRSEKKSAPAASLTGRSKIGGFHEDLQKTPGPGAYSVTSPGKYKNSPPAYSMTSRNAMPGDSTTKPGPGAHSPEPGYNFTRKSALAAASVFVTRSTRASPSLMPIWSDWTEDLLWLIQSHRTIFT